MGFPKTVPPGAVNWRRTWRSGGLARGNGTTGNCGRDGVSGGDEFKREIAERVRAGIGPEHYGTERREGAESLAEAIVEEEMRRRGWGGEELARRAKGDGDKMAIAERLRAETTVPVSWIAERLAMGTRGYLNHLLHRRRKASGRKYAKTKN
jgi:hypothetical protein